MEDSSEVIRIPGLPLPSVSAPQSYEHYRGTDTALVIDNGSTNLRFGFATSNEPISVSNIISKFRERKQNRPMLLLGDAIDVESGARTQARTPWEGDVLLNFDALVSDIQPTNPIIALFFGLQSDGEVTSDMLDHIGERVRLRFHQFGHRHAYD
jgi:hypothetical protein